MRQRFETHRLIEQLATEDFRCIGIFVAYISNDIPEVFMCRVKNCDVHADSYWRAPPMVSLTIRRASSSV
jgi:hypothetical protein